MNYSRSSKELQKAWFDFKDSQKGSGYSGLLNLTSFSAGFNCAMDLVNNPKPIKPRIGYIIVNYNLFLDYKPKHTIFADGNGKSCIVSSKTFTTYVAKPDKDKDVGVYEKRKDARYDCKINNEDDSENKEMVWKVELDSKSNKIIKWLKKNP
jgi:hypothetical protein